MYQAVNCLYQPDLARICAWHQEMLIVHHEDFPPRPCSNGYLGYHHKARVRSIARLLLPRTLRLRPIHNMTIRADHG